MPGEIDQAHDLIARRLLIGKVVPVLGAGVNLYGRPEGVTFSRGKYLPSGRELAALLAFDYPAIDSRDLAVVSQYVSSRAGNGALYDELHDVFDADYPPTPLHHFLTKLSRRIRESQKQCMLIVTTNYDDSLERAFLEESEPYDLLIYLAEGPDRGCFRHTRPDGTTTVIRKPNEYSGLGLDQNAVITKIHGAVDRVLDADSYVITEDDYIDYITRADINGLFPATLAAKMRKNHLLFLGYSLRDWNLRVMLYRLWREQQGQGWNSWAIQADPNPIDQVAWNHRGVDILPVRVEEFVAAIQERMATDSPEEVA